MDSKKIKDDRDMAQEEPQVIAEFPIQPEFTRTEQYLYEYNHCFLCGNELEFTHVTNFVQGEVKEEAQCPTCRISSKEDHHTLH